MQSSPPAPVWQSRSNLYQKWSLLFLCDHQNGSCVYSRNPCHHINRCSSLYSPNADFDFHHQCSPVPMRISKVAAVSVPGVLVTLKFQLIIAIIATGSCLASQVQSPPKVVSLVLMRPSKWQLCLFQKSLPPHQQMQQSLFPKCRLRFSPSVFSCSYANIKSCSSLYSRSPCHFEVSTHYCNHRHRLLFGKPSPISTKSGLSCSYATIKMVAVSIPEILATTSTDAAVSIPQMQTSILTISVLMRILKVAAVSIPEVLVTLKFQLIIAIIATGSCLASQVQSPPKVVSLVLMRPSKWLCLFQKSLPPHQQMQQSLFPKCRLPFVPSVFFRSHANIKSCSSLYSRSPCHFEISTHYCNHRHRLLFGKPSPISTKSGLSCSYATIKMVAVSIPEILTTTSTDAAVSIPQMQTSILTISVLLFLCEYQKLQQSLFQESLSL